MTAIAVGRTMTSNFLVIDGMVQQRPSVKNNKECLLKDKMTTFRLTEQFVILYGEELISWGASFLSQWSEMNKTKINLFERDCFEQLLVCVDKSRQYSIDTMGWTPIEQEKTGVYIASRDRIKSFDVVHNGKNYIISNESIVPQNSAHLIYRGELKVVNLSDHNDDLVKFGIEKLEEEHKWRKLFGKVKGKLPLDYDFNERFSSVILPKDKLIEIERKYPFNELTDIFLSFPSGYADIWDYVEASNFRFSPIINART